MKTIKICLFCGKNHKDKTPKICKAKNAICNLYSSRGVPAFQIMMGIKSGAIDLEGMAKLIVKGV